MTRDRRIIDLDGPHEPTEPQATEYYSIYAACENCDYEDETEIAKGVKVGEAECPHCGCQSLYKAKPVVQEEKTGVDVGEPGPAPLLPSPPIQTQPWNPTPRDINPHPMIPHQPHRTPGPYEVDRNRMWMSGITPQGRDPQAPIESFGVDSLSGNAISSAAVALSGQTARSAAGHQAGLLAALASGK